MEKLTVGEIMSKLDPLKEYEDRQEFNSGGEKTVRRVFYSDNLLITTYSSNDKVITAECPQDSTQGCHPHTEVKGTHQNIKAQ